MAILIRYTSENYVYCPKCGSVPSAVGSKTAAHCGHCGTDIITERLDAAVETAEMQGADGYEQLTLFDK